MSNNTQSEMGSVTIQRELSIQQDVQDSFLELIKINPERAITLVTGMFVGILIEYTRQNGHNADGSITINGGNNRDITIHAVKTT